MIKNRIRSRKGSRQKKKKNRIGPGVKKLEHNRQTGSQVPELEADPEKELETVAN